jgi:Meiotically up-regulated gene 113
MSKSQIGDPNFFPDWDWLQQNTPVFAQAVFNEYCKNNGLLPIETGYVYLIHAVGSSYYKIGKSIEPSRRILQIQPAMPFECEFVKIWPSYFMSDAEKYMHSQYSTYRRNGEWFEFNRKDIFDILRGQDAEWVRYRYPWNLFSLIKGEEYDLIDSEIKARCPSLDKNYALEMWVDDLSPMSWAERLFLEIYLSSEGMSTQHLPYSYALKEWVLTSDMETEK